jgi:hypothetical protein
MVRLISANFVCLLIAPTLMDGLPLPSRPGNVGQRRENALELHTIISLYYRKHSWTSPHLYTAMILWPRVPIHELHPFILRLPSAVLNILAEEPDLDLQDVLNSVAHPCRYALKRCRRKESY